MEYYIYHVPVFVMGGEPVCSIPEFCSAAEDTLSQSLLANVDVVYVGEMRELNGRNATYANAAIYMTSKEPTIEDMLENFVHEVAHSLEDRYAPDIYTQELVDEFKGKRARLKSILDSQGYQVNPNLYGYTEYNKTFDKFLSDEVGYPTLLNLTMGLFVSPYAATSIQEYFANGFEKYFLDEPRHVWSISPVLYEKIETVIHGEA